MKMKNFAMGVSLLLLLSLVSYLDSPYSILNKKISYTASEPAVTHPIDLTPQTDMPDLEEKLIKTKKEDGYITETYREYEVYKDKNGKVIKSVPTSKMDTLFYKDYTNN